MNFIDLKLHPALFRACKKAGLQNLTPIQEKAIPQILNNRDILALSPTGTGKTLAFLLPLLHQLGNAGRRGSITILILSPTRELAIQTYEQCEKYARFLPVTIAPIYGGGRYDFQLQALQERPDILIATPGRLLEYLEAGEVSLEHVQTLVLDEADRMLNMGFLPDVKKILTFLPSHPQTLLFSATMNAEIKKLSFALLQHPARIQIAESTDEPTAQVEEVSIALGENSKNQILPTLLRQPEYKKTLIFVNTKQTAEELADFLAKEGFKVRALHGDKTQGQRLDCIQRFKSGNIKVMVATDVAARGIDIPKLTHVVNYDAPKDRETYIHRIGRTGRAGAVGTAVSFI